MYDVSVAFDTPVICGKCWRVLWC